MSVRKELLKMGLGYLLGRVTSDVTVNDLRNVKPDDVKRWVNNLRAINTNDVLGMVGLQRRVNAMSHTVAVAGGFVAGMAVGATLALFLAPGTGADMRQKIVDFVTSPFGKNHTNNVDATAQPPASTPVETAKA